MILYQRVVALSSAALSNEFLAERIKQGEKQYITELWEQSYKLLYSYAFKYYTRLNERFINCGVTLEDLQQECFIIMLNMVESYDSEKGYKFNTYAEYQFKTHLRRLLRIGGNLAENPLNSCNSLSEPVTGLEDEDITIEDTLTDEAAELAYSEVEELVYQSQLHNALDLAMSERLTEQQAAIITDRFYNNSTLKECGYNNGVSLERVRQIERDSLKRLRISHCLDGFKEDILTAKAYQGTGLYSFKNIQASSVERTVEKLESLYNKQ